MKYSKLLSENLYLLLILCILVLFNNGQCNPTKFNLWPEIGETRDEILNHYSNRLQSHMDMSVNPCEDFYEYVCGNYELPSTIPENSGVTNQFELLQYKILTSLKEVSKEPIEQPYPVHTMNAEDKAKILFSACTDMDTINMRGAEPLLNFIDELGGWPVLDRNWNEDDFDVYSVLAKMSQMSLQFCFNAEMKRMRSDSSKVITHIDDPNLGLPFATYFKGNMELATAYNNFIEKILHLLNVDAAQAKETAKEIIEFEISTAFKIQPLVYHEPVYEETTVEDLTLRYPQFNFTKYFNLVFNKVVHPQAIVAFRDRNMLEKMIEIITETDKKTLANYLIWRNVKFVVDKLDDRFKELNNEFLKVRMGGLKPYPREEMCLYDVMETMGNVIGAIFVKNFFKESDKIIANEIVTNIKDSFKKSLKLIDWMDNETKQKSLEKLDALVDHIGYKPSILNYTENDKLFQNLEVHNGKYFENYLDQIISLQMVRYHAFMPTMNLVGASHTAASANAFYSPTTNSLTIPAGNFQHEVYNEYLPKALLYSGIGFFYGHELTHGFDNDGRKYDLNGNLIEWWTQESIDNFKEKAQCFIDQYGNMTFNGVQYDGVSSLGENMADNGGFQHALNGYRKWLKTAHRTELSNEHLPNFHMKKEQLFFLNFAHSFCGMKLQLNENDLEDPHPPSSARVLGVLRNSVEFSRAFKCPKGSPMNPFKKCRVW